MLRSMGPPFRVRFCWTPISCYLHEMRDPGGAFDGYCETHPQCSLRRHHPIQCLRQEGLVVMVDTWGTLWKSA